VLLLALATVVVGSGLGARGSGFGVRGSGFSSGGYWLVDVALADVALAVVVLALVCLSSRGSPSMPEPPCPGAASEREHLRLPPVDWTMSGEHGL